MQPQNPIMQKSWLAVLFMFVKSILYAGIKSSNVISDAIGMAEEQVAAARLRQTIDLSISEENYEADALDQASLARLKSSIAIGEYVQGNPEREAFFNQEREKLAACVAKRKAMLAAEKASD